MTTMTVEQAIERADLYREEEDADSVMGRVLADALREAQARCVRLSETNHAMFAAVLPGKAMRDDKVGQVKWAVSEFERRIAEAQAAVVQMREDAAKIADGVLDGPLPAGAFAIAVRISKAIRSLPAPAARTYDDGVRDAAKAVRSVETRIVHQRQEPITESDVLQIARDRSEACAAAVERLLSPAPAVAPVAAPNPRVIVAPPIDFSEEDAPKPVAFDAEAALVAAREAARTGLDRNPTVEARQIAHLLRRMLSDALAAGRGAR